MPPALVNLIAAKVILFGDRATAYIDHSTTPFAYNHDQILHGAGSHPRWYDTEEQGGVASTRVYMPSNSSCHPYPVSFRAVVPRDNRQYEDSSQACSFLRRNFWHRIISSAVATNQTDDMLLETVANDHKRMEHGKIRFDGLLLSTKLLNV